MRKATAVSSVPPLLLMTTIAQSVVAGDHVEQSGHGVVVDVVALEIDPRPAALRACARQLVVVRMAAGLEQRPGAHVRAADAQHHHAIDLAGQPIGRGEDVVQQRAVCGRGAARAGRRRRRPTAPSPQAPVRPPEQAPGRRALPAARSISRGATQSRSASAEPVAAPAARPSRA